jgi:uroporphyrinogen decarboxylase
MDAAILFSDIFMLSLALGHPVDYREGEGPVLPPIRNAAGVAALDPARLSAGIAPILETVRRVKAEVGAATLIGFAAAPFTLACYLVEGRGSKEFAQARLMAHADPALFAALMEVLTEATIGYLAGQIEAGAEVVMLFDSWAGVLSPPLFRAHVIEPTARIVAALRARHPTVPVIGFPRLAGVLLGDYAEATGVQGLHIDTAVDPALAAGMVPAKVALQGNLDPLAVVAGGAAMASEADAILHALRGRPHIFNLGHGILQQTPPEHLAALVRQVRSV